MYVSEFQKLGNSSPSISDECNGNFVVFQGIPKEILVQGDYTSPFRLATESETRLCKLGSMTYIFVAADKDTPKGMEVRNAKGKSVFLAPGSYTLA